MCGIRIFKEIKSVKIYNMKDFFKKIIIKIITWQAKVLIKRNNPKIIAITGNLGKTSTKDFIYAAIRKNLINEKGETLVLASRKSMNSDFGVPLTVLGLETGWTNPLLWLKIIINGFIKIFDYFPYKYLVLEIGADTPGDIKNICKYIKPDIAVITAFAPVPVHIEFFDNKRENLVREKKYLVENLKEGGTFIYNLDDEDCVEMTKEFANKNIKLKSFSLKNVEADVLATNININYEHINKYIDKVVGTHATLKLKNTREINIDLNGVVGEAVFYTLLPGIIVADILGIDVVKAVEDIENMKRTSGRMRTLSGVYNSTIIDDTYNSSPKALKNGISIMKSIKTKNKKIFVLGDMLELGDFTRNEHEEVGKLLVGVADILIVSGIRAKIIADSAALNGMNRENIYFVNNSLEAGREILILIEKEIENDFKEGKSESEIGGDIIFVKGSQGARMEKVVGMILDKSIHNSDKELVRQERDWKLR